jgi:hypothetical protein
MTDRLATVLRLARISVADLEHGSAGAAALLHIEVARSLAGPCPNLDRQMHLATFAGQAFLLDPSPGNEQTYHHVLDELAAAIRESADSPLDEDRGQNLAPKKFS